MIVFKGTREIERKAVEPGGGGNCLYLLHISELSALDPMPDIKAKLADGFDPDECTSKYENHDGHDMLFINIPEELRDMNSFRYLGVCISADRIICVYEEWEEQPYLIALTRASVGREMTHKTVVLALIDNLLRDDFMVLGNIEDEIAEMEDSVSSGEIESRMKDISSLRRKIRPMKRFYEHLVDMFGDIDDNDNGFFIETELKYASRISGRVERLYRTVLNLRDYITQVREAYQAQMDIGLNVVMKTFTVITAIFLPLTLLAGWYGMNLRMPEFDWKFGYLFVIGISISIVVFCLAMFKKKNWF
jgi:magnesium transporter